MNTNQQKIKELKKFMMTYEFLADFNEESIKIDLALIFARQMEEKDVSIEDISKQTNIKLYKLKKILKGKSNFTIEEYAKICAYLGINIKKINNIVCKQQI